MKTNVPTSEHVACPTASMYMPTSGHLSNLISYVYLLLPSTPWTLTSFEPRRLHDNQRKDHIGHRDTRPANGLSKDRFRGDGSAVLQHLPVRRCMLRLQFGIWRKSARTGALSLPGMSGRDSALLDRPQTEACAIWKLPGWSTWSVTAAAVLS